MSRYTAPRTPAHQDDVYFPMRDSSRLWGILLNETGKVPLVPTRDRSVVPGDGAVTNGRVRELEAKIDDLVSCLNKLTTAVSGR